MMKRVFSLLLTAVMIFALVPSVFAADHVLPDAIKNDPERMQDLYQYGGWPLNLEGYANLWYVYEGNANGAEWPAEYLDIFEKAIDECAFGDDCTLYGYEWHGNKLIVDFGVTFNVKYRWNVGNAFTELDGPLAEDFVNGLALAVTDNGGNLIRVISDDSPDFVPELKYDMYVRNNLAWQFLSLEEAIAFEEHIGMEREYTYECRQTAEITLPGDFDPELYNITLYFETHEDTMAFMESAPRFSTPFEIEYEYDYFLTYPVDGSLDFPYTLTETAPERVADYFENLIADEKEPGKYDYMKLYNMSLLESTYTFSINTGGSNFVNYKVPNTSYEEILCRKQVHLIAAVRDAETSEILSVEKVGHQIDNAHVYRDLTLTLPDFYDCDRHEVTFFRYELDFYPDGDFSKASDVPAVSVTCVTVESPQDYIFGDADKNGHVNLADITLMMKYIAKWDGVTKEVAPYVANIFESSLVEYNCFYNMPMIATTMKIIAGWKNVKVGSYDLARCAAATYSKN